MGKLCIKLLLFVLLAAVGFSYYMNDPRFWVYDANELHNIAKSSIAKAKAKHGDDYTGQQVVDEVIKGVLEAYPQTSTYTGRWLWNNAGGAMGSMTVLHCSFTEYLIVFGTATGTEGHTGRYHVTEDFFHILKGTQWAALPGPTPGLEVYNAGDMHYLPRATAKQYRMPEECWALEYARGNIVAMLFFGFADSLSSTLDFVTVFHTVRESAGNMIPNILRGKI